MNKHRIEETTRRMQDDAMLSIIDASKIALASIEKRFLNVTRENARLKEQLTHLRSSKRKPSAIVIELRRKLTDKNKHLALQQKEIAELLAENAALKRKTTRRRKKI
ncbi:MAG: hypothetical protein UR66_C0009G0057 [Candidatus Moranbacteria bacterium GW2011_GWE1_35_17]|nr:MAG: hypothetical protein UR66_C0009G0057 [Candidatus Moranbacteria bacterium GW2011_GWE1_35_17]KKP83136.1 MAG: hypothetical protein UR82_C0024G0014 [Candidatus Moranbacteria bacterium GW2011_GWF1_35_5]KKP84002.1 MAG: hypothetical protein UR83_C0029G0035 [Candidatus Moranbacteria bacterium GW2011_GWF2_35_54]